MCDPATLTAVMIAGTVVSAGMGIAGGVAQQQQANANAKLAKQSAAFDESAARDQAKRLMGAQRAAYGKAGVDIGSGSPLDVQADTAQQQEIDALAIRWGGKQQAAKFRGEGQQALIGGFASAGDSLLTGLTSWQKAKGAGTGTFTIGDTTYGPVG